MKARTRVPVEIRPGHVHPAGTEVEVLEWLAPHVCIVEFMVPDDGLVGGAWYEHQEMERSQLDFESSAGPSGASRP
jgi:hypothetical protein